MPRNHRQQVEEPGQDSFLDIVANLVGILIILIMVIGVRATDAMVEAKPETEEPEQKIDLVAAKAAAKSAETGLHEVNAKIKRQEVEVAYRRRERDKIQTLIASAENVLAEKRKQLDGSKQEQLALSRDLDMARRELEDLKNRQRALDLSVQTNNVIEHLPTPMAKTVFGKELHFRLKDGRLVYVPMEEFVGRLQEDARQRAWKLKNSQRFTETIGPIRDFMMEYTLMNANKLSSVGGGIALQQRIELDFFILKPVREDLGEPLARALQPGSQFHTLLSDHDPHRTTITVWVYPNSFNEFRELKAALFKSGFLTAGRPKGENEYISGSPRGSRSSAQ